MLITAEHNDGDQDKIKRAKLSDVWLRGPKIKGGDRGIPY